MRPRENLKETEQTQSHFLGFIVGESSAAFFSVDQFELNDCLRAEFVGRLHVSHITGANVAKKDGKPVVQVRLTILSSESRGTLLSNFSCTLSLVEYLGHTGSRRGPMLCINLPCPAKVAAFDTFVNRVMWSSELSRGVLGNNPHGFATPPQLPTDIPQKRRPFARGRRVPTGCAERS